MNSMSAENFMRSAMAPTISAGVMMANISWYIAEDVLRDPGRVVRVRQRRRRP